MKTKLIAKLQLAEMDTALTCLAWDAEYIWREAHEPSYLLAPASPRDGVIAKLVGASVAAVLRAPVLIHRNDSEET